MPRRLKKRHVSFWMKQEMIENLDTLKESRGLSSRGDMIRMLLESHPEYREAAQ